MSMTAAGETTESRAVSPLELFYDLVFVFAISQLSQHLLDDLSWRGAAETLVLLGAVSRYGFTPASRPPSST
jgi:low temperature requirement protein LtrA